MQDTQKVVINTLSITMSNGGYFKIEDLPAHSIALDGAVRGPILEDTKDRWSFDHHSNCNRLITQATCQQVFTALRLGFDPSNRTIYINDIDADVLVSLWLLDNYKKIQGLKTATQEFHNISSCVNAVGSIDTHGTMGMKLLTETDNIKSKIIYQKLQAVIPRDIQAVYGDWDTLLIKGISAVEEMIDFVSNITSSNRETYELQIKKEPPDTVIIYSEEIKGIKMCMAYSDSLGAFLPLYEEGYKVVCLVSEAEKDSLRYTIGKLSDLVKYPLGPEDNPESLLGRLDAQEAGWGGSSSIGGSPRLPGGISSYFGRLKVWYEMTKI